MRLIDKIIIHHSFTPKDLDLNKSIQSFSKNHKERLHQPQSKTGLFVAYHYVIGANGKAVQTRLDDEIGYHASNWPVNKTSIGICLLGNFEKEKPNPIQLWSLRDTIKDIKARHYIKEVSGHRKYSSKSCPGKNLTDKMIDEAFHPIKH
jgi:N-acetyl-anhydromuramyl-L-alanine amidase AmpD